MAETAHRPRGSRARAKPDADTEAQDTDAERERTDPDATPRPGEHSPASTDEKDGADKEKDGAPDGDGNDPVEAEQPEMTYSVEELRADARGLFQCSPHMVAGALSRDPDKLWTVAEAREAIADFASREHGA